MFNFNFNYTANSFEVTWSDDCNGLAIKYLAPSGEEIFYNRKLIQNASMLRLIPYFQKNGIDFRVDPKTLERISSIKDWKDKLVESDLTISTEMVFEMMFKIGLDFRVPQIAAISKICTRNFHILAALCGMGKTITMLSSFQVYKWAYKKVKVLYIAPLGCSGEMNKDLTQNRGKFDLTLKDLSNFSGNESKENLFEQDITVINIEKAHVITKEVYEYQKKNPETLFILAIDEAHCIKNPNARRFKAVDSIACFFDKIIISTATPMPKDFTDLRSYIKPIYLPSPIEDYKDSVPARDQLILDNVSFVSTEDDLNYYPVANQRFSYDDLQDLDTKMLETVESEIKQGFKVLIFCTTNKAMRDIYNKLEGYNKVVLSGTYSTPECEEHKLTESSCDKEARRKSIQDFNHNEMCQVAIANFKVGSTGLNLQHSGARTVFYYQVTNVGADLFQSQYRIRRPFVDPEGGFKYIFAIPSSPKKRATAIRQFLKLDKQNNFLKQIWNKTKAENQKLFQLFEELKLDYVT